MDRLGKACVHNPDMHSNEKSDIIIAPKKAPNNTGLPVAEVLDGRPMANENSGKLSAICTQRQGEALNGIREAAARDGEAKFWLEPELELAEHI